MTTMLVNEALAPLIETPKPLKIAIGGRGSGKSIGFGDVFIMKMEVERADVYCLREHQISIADSVHRVFKDSITERLKLEGWTILANKVIAPSGAQTTYRGASRNPDNIQSAQGYRYSWFEEAHRASENSLDKLIPTIIRAKGAECWFSANPQSSADPFSKRFITPYLKYLERDNFYEDEMHLIVVVNWRDNPWWNDEQENLRTWDLAHLPRAKYDWIWEGKFNDTVEKAIIKPEWFDAAINAHGKLGFTGRGAIIAAYDPSDKGQDPKGYALRHGSVVLDVREKDTGDVNDGCDWALGLAIKANADYFTWDCDGMGISLQRQVSEVLSGKKIEPIIFKGSEGPEKPDAIYENNMDLRGQLKNRQTFKNKRAQYYTRLRDRFYNTYCAVEKGQYIDPDIMISFNPNIAGLQALRSQICRIPFKDNGAGLIQIMNKVEMKAMGINSPNESDSIMMTLFNPIPETYEDMTFDSEF